MSSSIRTRFFAAVVVVFLALLAPRPASALEPAYTAGSTQFSGGPRFGTDNLNFGLGIRGGHTLDNGLYLGGSFDFFFGESEDYWYLNRYRASWRFWTLSFEGGYDFHIVDRLVVRPFGGLGAIGVIGESCSPLGCGDTSDTDFLFTFGGLLHYFVTEKMFLGPDTRILVSNDTAFVLGGHFGVAF